MFGDPLGPNDFHNHGWVNNWNDAYQLEKGELVGLDDLIVAAGARTSEGFQLVEAIAQVVSRIRHVHIRDCKGRQQGPGAPEDQACGRGDIDLLGYVSVLHENGYSGPVDLEVIGAKAR